MPCKNDMVFGYFLPKQKVTNKSCGIFIVYFSAVERVPMPWERTKEAY